MREYIVAVEDDTYDFEEIFVGEIRKQDEVIRCIDCKYFVNVSGYKGYCSERNDLGKDATPYHYCAWGKRIEE